MSGAKVEPKVKGEPKTGAAAVKAELLRQCQAAKLKAEVKGEPKASAAAVKAELLRQSQGKLKAEAKLKVEAPSRVADLVERGLQLRAMARAKQERERKVKKEVKVKVEGRAAGKGKRRKTAGSRRGVRRKGSAARRNASREVMNREIPLSQELGELVGAPALSRPEVVKRLWAHFREKGMLNPADKREAIFDDRLKAIFGKTSARIFDLPSLLVPHLDYTGCGGQAAAAEPQTPSAAKGEQAACPGKREAKSEAPFPDGTKRERTEEAPAVVPAKRERTQEAAEPLKRELPQGAEPLKREPTSPLAGIPPETVAAALRTVVPRFTKISHTSAVVEFQAPPGGYRLEAVATPLSEAPGEPARQLCKVELRETAEDTFEPCGEAILEGLDPGTAYRVSVEAVVASDEGAATSLRSTEATLPQRSLPAKWTPNEAQLWCGSLQVPELLRKVREYRIDGATLLALGEEDLRAMGLSAPFLLRRVMAALQELRAA